MVETYRPCPFCGEPPSAARAATPAAPPVDAYVERLRRLLSTLDDPTGIDDPEDVWWRARDVEAAIVVAGTPGAATPAAPEALTIEAWTMLSPQGQWDAYLSASRATPATPDPVAAEGLDVERLAAALAVAGNDDYNGCRFEPVDPNDPDHHGREFAEAIAAEYARLAKGAEG